MARDLTDKLVASLTSNGKPQFEYYDGQVAGLLIRVTKARSKTWDFTFKSPVDGKRARLKLGPYTLDVFGSERRRKFAGARRGNGQAMGEALSP
jgi:hypothetical protein